MIISLQCSPSKHTANAYYTIMYIAKSISQIDKQALLTNNLKTRKIVAYR